MISIYSDGASSAKGGQPGGWGFVIVRDETHVICAAYGSDPSTTNNIMELTGAIRGMEAALEQIRLGMIGRGEPIELVSDSQYVLGLASGRFTPSANLELAKQAKQLLSTLRGKDRWVRGHKGDVWNERCDSLAGKGKQEAKIQRQSE